MSQELLYQIGLTFIPKVGNIIAKNLISYCGGIESVFKTPKRQLLKIPGVGNVIAENIVKQKNLIRADKELDFVVKNEIKCLFYTDDLYPSLLKQIPNSPLLLYSKGNYNFLNKKTLAVVGTRKSTHYGNNITKKFLTNLKPLNPLIISGLAYGIDAVAHKSSIENKMKTVAVLGHGLDRVFPAAHRKLAEEITQNGALLTEFPSGTIPERENFPMRNRIIAGMSQGLLIVESAKKGGAVLTANMAFDYNRNVMAVPGPLNAMFSEGCNHLIKEQKASLVTSSDDVLEQLNWDINDKISQSKMFDLSTLSQEELEVLNCLKEGNVSLNHLKSNLFINNKFLPALLLNLEFKGLVNSLPGNRYGISF